MYKAFILFALLLVLGAGGMLYANTALTAAQDDVSFTETASYGDVSAADGLTVSVRAQLKDHLLWDTEYIFGQTPRTDTDFSFSPARLKWQPDRQYEAFRLSIASDFFSSVSGGNLLDNIEGNLMLGHGPNSFAVILRDVASHAENGERHSETIVVRDYFDFYPINADFVSEQLPFIYYYKYGDTGRIVSQVADADEVGAIVSSYFKIPVPESHRMTVELYKDSAGNVTELHMSQEGPIQLSAVGVQTKAGVYFALQTEGVTDFSGIRGGFGIYLLPASTITGDEGEELPTLDYHNLSTVYPLNESTSVRSLNLSEDERCLELITLEDGGLFLTVIDIASMTEKQKLCLFDDARDAGFQTPNYVDGLLFVLLGDGRFVLAETNDHGINQIVLSGTRNVELLNERAVASGYYRLYEPLVAWDGARLALITVAGRFVPNDDDPSFSYSYDTCGFDTEIYDTSGLKYKGIYESSLDVPAAQNNYNNRCRPIDAGSLALSW